MMRSKYLLPIHFIIFHLSKQIHLETFSSKQLPTVLCPLTTHFAGAGSGEILKNLPVYYVSNSKEAFMFYSFAHVLDLKGAPFLTCQSDIRIKPIIGSFIH